MWGNNSFISWIQWHQCNEVNSSSLVSNHRCDISVCYKPDSSSDWRLSQTSAQIQPLNPTFCSLLCLPIVTFSGALPWKCWPNSDFIIILFYFLWMTYFARLYLMSNPFASSCSEAQPLKTWGFFLLWPAVKRGWIMQNKTKEKENIYVNKYEFVFISVWMYFDETYVTDD